MTKPIYAVLDKDGNIEGLESSREGAIERAEETSDNGAAGVFVDPAVYEDMSEVRSNPPPTPEIAYEMTMLPAILMHKYGVDHLTGQMVHDVDLNDAYQTLRPFFPPGKDGEQPGQNWMSATKAAASFFSNNAKMAKGLKKTMKAGVKSGDLGDLTVSMGLALAPHQVGFRDLRDVGPAPVRLQASERLRMIASDGEGGGVDPEHLAILMQRGGTLCARSTAGCRSSCLVFSGQNEAANEPYIFKMAMTAALFHDPLAFARILLEASRRHFYMWSVKGVNRVLTKGGPKVHLYARERVSEEGVPPGAFIRLNIYSDIPWELFFPDLVHGDWAFMPPYARGKRPDSAGAVEVVSDGMWYDYSAVYGRWQPGTNYDVTMSFKGSASNVADVRRALKDGQRIATVFVAQKKKGGWSPSGGKQLRDKFKDSDEYPWEFMGKRVWNADRTDIRPDDPDGYVAGLTYKVPRKKVSKGNMEQMADLNELVGIGKFVIEVIEVDGHLLAIGTPIQENSTDFVDDAEARREIAAL